MIWILCVLTVFFSGCQQKAQENHYTEVVVDTPTQTQTTTADPHAGLDMSSMAMPDMENPTIMNTMYSWLAPEGWKQEPGQGFRLASFHLSKDEKAIDCSVISLAGVAGGLEANLKRWMGQIGIETSQEQLTKLINSATTIKIKNGQEGKVFDFTTIQSSPNAKSMVVVMLNMSDATLFVKMTGTKETVDQNKQDFFSLVKSIEPKEETGGLFAQPRAEVDMKDPHAGMDIASMGAMVESSTPTSSVLAWTVPESWKEEPAGHMRLATFHLVSDPKLLDCSIISLGGPAGGLEANLARWAGQLGLASSQEILSQLTGASTSVKTKDGVEIKVYDFTSIQKEGKTSDKSMIAAMLPMDGATVFIKMTGSIEVVKQNKDKLIKLLSSITHK